MQTLSLTLVVCFAAAAYGLPSTQIVGGMVAPDGKFPYQVSLRKNGRHFCGGSIIASRYVLTAAHCVDGQTAAGITVHVGTNQSNQPGQQYQVEKISAHPNYNSRLIINDVAVLRVKGAIAFNNKVQPIKLASGSKTYEGSPCVLSGWGTLKAGGSVPVQLQYINLVIESQAQCKKTWNGMVRDSHICSFTKHGEGACNGDSGGPLVVNGEQVGIVSFGRPCGVGSPDVYTRVTSFNGWIKQQENFLREAGEPDEIQIADE